MKKIENYCSCLSVLEKGNFQQAQDDEIYRMGMIGQFQLTFELAWKALKAVLELDGVQSSDTGSPRDVLKTAASVGFLKDDEVWLLMLKKRNLSTHIYDEEEADELMILLRDSFIPAFRTLRDFLMQKQAEIEADDKEEAH